MCSIWSCYKSLLHNYIKLVERNFIAKRSMRRKHHSVFTGTAAPPLCATLEAPLFRQRWHLKKEGVLLKVSNLIVSCACNDEAFDHETKLSWSNLEISRYNSHILGLYAMLHFGLGFWVLFWKELWIILWTLVQCEKFFMKKPKNIGKILYFTKGWCLIVILFIFSK